MQTPMEFAESWYPVDQVHRSIVRRQKHFPGDPELPPGDVTSREFAEWLTYQYRLAMAKGIQIGRHQGSESTADER